MTTPEPSVRLLERPARPSLRESLKARLEHRDESGQTLVIIVILLVLLVALAPLMARQVTADAPLLGQSSDYHAALAAAEAGIHVVPGQPGLEPELLRLLVLEPAPGRRRGAVGLLRSGSVLDL